MPTIADLILSLPEGSAVSPELDPALPVSRVVNDSRRVEPGSLFVAVRGERLDGHRFLRQAAESGACALVVEEMDAVRRSGVSVPVIVVPGAAVAYSYLVEAFYGHPARSLRLLGVTGTNGKTSTAYILRDLVRGFGHGCGLVSTVEYDNGRISEIAERTTPEPGVLQRLFREIVDNGCEYAAMEVSSHALVQGRTGAARFAGAIFTNLTGDHLDYHGDMESYFQAKRRLFRLCLSDDGVMAVNLDDPYGARLFAEFRGERPCLGFGRRADGASVILRVSSNLAGSEIEVRMDGRPISGRTNLIGDFNAYNVVGAATLAVGLGIGSVDDVFRVFRDCRISVPGRLEAVALPSGARAFIDYAHTDDALEKALAALRPVTPRRLIVVFGCGGDRDRTKRPRMGRVAVAGADRVIVTSDNPRSESPDAIIADIVAGIPASERGRVRVCPDRIAAVSEALAEAVEGDAVLIAGKGHENYQEIAGIRSVYSDQAVVACFLQRESLRCASSSGD